MADLLTNAAIDTDGTFTDASDLLVPSQLAVKTYVDTEIAGIVSSSYFPSGW